MTRDTNVKPIIAHVVVATASRIEHRPKGFYLVTDSQQAALSAKNIPTATPSREALGLRKTCKSVSFVGRKVFAAAPRIERRSGGFYLVTDSQQAALSAKTSPPQLPREGHWDCEKTLPAGQKHKHCTNLQDGADLRL